MGLNFLILIILIRLTSATHQVGSSSTPPHFARSECPRKGFSYILGSTFEANLNHTLLDILPNNVLVNGSSSFISGQGIDQVNALCYCRGDVAPQDCRNCVQSAAGTVLQHCRPLKEGIAWYEECTLRYSNRSIFSLEEEVPSYRSYNFSSVLNTLEGYGKVFDDTMDGLIHQAGSGSTAVGKLRGFATSEAELAGSGLTLRGLMQCSPDIVGGPCERCLRSALKQMDGWPTTIIFLPSCNLRFDLFPSAPKPPGPHPPGGTTKKVIILVVVAGLSSLILCGVAAVAYLLRNSIRRFYNQVVVRSTRGICNRPQAITVHVQSEVPTPRPTSPRVELQPSQYTFKDLQAATNYFSDEIGKGGFAIVYKGIWSNGREIAVKRLSNILHGDEDFMKEVSIMAKLHHENLVRLSGFCLENNERLLVFEYFPNGSLDKVLYGQKEQHLSWRTRYNIIKGIARGMCYLHKDHPTKGICIHRDLKPHNVLLDADMEPKICDFGLARICSQTIEASKIAGTFGYMAPEYMRGKLFSVKSDVYSFGVIVLEIVSGQKISAFIQQSGVGADSLISHARRCWENNRPSDLMDKILKKDSYSNEEVIRCIQLGLLCVQEDRNERPNSEDVFSALNLGSAGANALAEPQHPIVNILRGIRSHISINSTLKDLISDVTRHQKGKSSCSNSMSTGQSNNEIASSSAQDDETMDTFHSPMMSPSRHIN